MILHYDDHGPGPVVVLLHGFPLDHTMFEAQRRTLGAVYRLICPDLRGHGLSSAPDGIYPIEDMAADVVELLDTLKINEPVVLGGLSMGGYVALALAVKHPKRLRGLILMDTRAGADSPEAARGREELAQKVMEAGTAEPAVAALMPRLWSPATRIRRPDLISRFEGRMLKTPARAVAGALRGMAARPDRTGDLARLHMPTLVMVGSDDVITPPAEARTLAHALPNAQLVEIPEAGHLAPLENPGPADEALSRFLQSLA